MWSGMRGLNPSLMWRINYDGNGNYTDVGLFYKNLNSMPSIPEPTLNSTNNLDQNFSSDDTAIWSDEAENGIPGGGTVLKTGCANASGTEFISLEPGASSSLTYDSVNMLAEGSYFLTIYHFNASDVTLNCMINGSATEVILKASNWCYQGAPGKTTVSVDLQNGLNELQFYDNENVAVLLDRFEIFGSVSTRIQDSFMNSLSFYPNPVNHTLRFDSESPLPGVIIYNLNGEVVLVRENVKKLNVSSLFPGIYFIQSGSQVEKFLKK